MVGGVLSGTASEVFGHKVLFGHNLVFGGPMFYGHLVTFMVFGISHGIWHHIKGILVNRFLESRHSGNEPGALIKLMRCPFAIMGPYDHKEFNHVTIDSKMIKLLWNVTFP